MRSGRRKGQGGIQFSNHRSPRPRRAPDRHLRKVQTPKKKRLNLRRMIEFKYELNKILAPLPENITGTMKGSLIAKADKIDIDAAFDFIDQKVQDGTIGEETRESLYKLLKYFCIYR